MDSIEQSPDSSEYYFDPNSFLQNPNDVNIETEEMHVEEKPQLSPFIVMDTKKQRNISETEVISKPKIKVLKKMSNTVGLDIKLENKTEARNSVKVEPMVINPEMNGGNVTGKCFIN